MGEGGAPKPNVQQHDDAPQEIHMQILCVSASECVCWCCCTISCKDVAEEAAIAAAATSSPQCLSFSLSLSRLVCVCVCEAMRHKRCQQLIVTGTKPVMKAYTPHQAARHSQATRQPQPKHKLRPSLAQAKQSEAFNRRFNAMSGNTPSSPHFFPNLL